MKASTPIKAIRARCIDCGGGSPKEVRECTHSECPLYQYRFGKRPQEKTLTPMKAIRAHCVACCNGNTREANLCPAQSCPLQAFKSGHRPKTDNSSITEKDFKNANVAPTFLPNKSNRKRGDNACIQ